MTIEPVSFTYSVEDVVRACWLDETHVRRILRRLVVRPWHMHNREYNWSPDEFRNICEMVKAAKGDKR